MNVAVSLSAASGRNVTVNYRTLNGTALEALALLQAENALVYADSLILVQGAVAWGSIYAGPVDFYPAERPSRGYSGGLPRPVTFQQRGEYLDCLSLARQLVILASRGDDVLTNWYYLDQQAFARAGGFYLPNILTPVGVPKPGHDMVIKHDRFQHHDFSPNKRRHISVEDHSQLFKDQALVDFLWEQVVSEHIR